MADTYFVGLRGTSDLTTNERMENWRAGILRLFPNGMAPLTALTALMPSEKTDDIHFHWWTKTLSAMRTAVTGVYTDSALAVAYVSGGVAGTVLYIKMAEASINMFRAGQQVLLRDASDYTVDVNAKVLSVTSNGASSYIAVRLLEADNNSTTHDLSDCDVVTICGNINPQGGVRPVAIAQSPTEFSNYTQIFRDSLDITRTLMQTKLRTENAYLEAKRDALEQHSIGMEKAFLWGVQSIGVGDNGKPESTTDGIIANIRTYGTVSDFTLDTDYSGKSWIETGGGCDWFEENLELMFRYGGTERLGFCGSGALLGIQRLVRELGFYTISKETASYGIKVLAWETPFGTVTLKSHPLFSYEATNRNSIVFFEPANLRYRSIQDTIFKPDNSDTQGGGTGKDGKEEEYLTEAGLEIHHPITCAYLNGIGQDNTLS